MLAMRYSVKLVVCATFNQQLTVAYSAYERRSAHRSVRNSAVFRTSVGDLNQRVRIHSIISRDARRITRSGCLDCVIHKLTKVIIVEHAIVTEQVMAAEIPENHVVQVIVVNVNVRNVECDAGQENASVVARARALAQNRVINLLRDVVTQNLCVKLVVRKSENHVDGACDDAHVHATIGLNDDVNAVVAHGVKRILHVRLADNVKRHLLSLAAVKTARGSCGRCVKTTLDKVVDTKLVTVIGIDFSVLSDTPP